MLFIQCKNLGYFSLMSSYFVSNKYKTFTKNYLFIFQTNNNEIDQISNFFSYDICEMSLLQLPTSIKCLKIKILLYIVTIEQYQRQTLSFEAVHGELLILSQLTLNRFANTDRKINCVFTIPVSRKY